MEQTSDLLCNFQLYPYRLRYSSNYRKMKIFIWTSLTYDPLYAKTNFCKSIIVNPLQILQLKKLMP